ncbi:hypothetical protein KP509_02G060200 [Ceratopteris richardii]|uniref:LOB domain-containing protein n=1 Tax=Ceratopteris richardii TaxID=49495 RepID=A0A8T2V9F4_CERRI|nr:hypothetical protein KP509_02G060200 [Ceratopteris richardii]
MQYSRIQQEELEHKFGCHEIMENISQVKSGMRSKDNVTLDSKVKPRLNTTTPCAACRLLRRRCAQQCPFAPYFPPQEPQRFAYVHKVYGASNVSKMLLEVPEAHREDVANSLVYEADTRIRDPIFGCMGVVSKLQHQIKLLQAELNSVKSEIMDYKLLQLQRVQLQGSPSGCSGDTELFGMESRSELHERLPTTRSNGKLALTTESHVCMSESHKYIMPSSKLHNI